MDDFDPIYTRGQVRALVISGCLFIVLALIAGYSIGDEGRDELHACLNSLDHAHIEYETHMHDEHGAYQ